MIARYRGGEIAPAQGSDAVRDAIAGLGSTVLECLDAWDLTGALESIWAVVRRLNAYVEETKPWELAKDDARSAELDQVLFDLTDGLRALAVALAAYVPRTSAAILDALGQPQELGWENVAPGRTTPAAGIEAAPPLFPRVDAPAAA
jgi:methionyl-tRNA synthetase